MQEKSCFEKNMEALFERNTDVANYVKDYLENNLTNVVEEEAVAFTELINSKKVLSVSQGSAIYRLESTIDNNDLTNVWLETVSDEWYLNAKLCMYGFGTGIFVRKFLEGTREDCSIVVHEPISSIFIKVLKEYDISDILLNPRFRLVFWPVAKKKGEVSYFYFKNVFEYSDKKTYRLSFHMNYPRILYKDCVDFREGILETHRFLAANQHVVERFGYNFNYNTFSNFKYIGDSYSLEKLINSVPENIPAIIVSAGPSLDKNIHQLAKAKGKCILIATDTALRPLAKANIIPDIAITVDGKKDEKYMSEESSRYVPLVCSPRSGGGLIKLHEGKKFFIKDYCEHLADYCSKHFISLPNVAMGGSVANAAFSLAIMMNCTTLILVGQDLAYTGDKTHSTVTVRGEKHTAVEDLENVVWCKDIYGNDVRSSGEFTIYRKWFEDQIKANSKLNVIDATEGGAYIEGSLLLTLDESIAEYCTNDFDFGELIDKTELLFDDKSRQDYVEFVKNIPNELEEVKNIAEDIVSNYRIIKNLILKGKGQASEIKRRFSYCQTKTKEFDKYAVMEYVINELQEKSSILMENVNIIEKDERTELIAACDLGINYLTDVIDTIASMDKYYEIIDGNVF